MGGERRVVEWIEGGGGREGTRRKENKRERETERESLWFGDSHSREGIFDLQIHIPNAPITARSEPDLSHEHKSPSIPLMWVAETQVLEPYPKPAASQQACQQDIGQKQGSRDLNQALWYWIWVSCPSAHLSAVPNIHEDSKIFDLRNSKDAITTY